MLADADAALAAEKELSGKPETITLVAELCQCRVLGSSEVWRAD